MKRPSVHYCHAVFGLPEVHSVVGIIPGSRAADDVTRSKPPKLNSKPVSVLTVAGGIIVEIRIGIENQIVRRSTPIAGRNLHSGILILADREELSDVVRSGDKYSVVVGFLYRHAFNVPVAAVK